MDVSCSQRDMILYFMLYLLNKSNTSNKKLKQYSFMKWNDKENEEKVVDIFKILSESLDFFSFFFYKKMNIRQEEINYLFLNRILFIIYY